MEQKRVPAYEGKKPYLFVSYAHRDSAAVLPAVSELFDKKYRVWYDEGIAPGSEWPKNIADHLNAADGVIVFVSENYLASPNCENEVVKAAEGGKRIFRCSLDGSSHPKLADKEHTVVGNTEELISVIGTEYIGDGTGYERNIGKKKHGAVWNILIAVAAVFMLTVGAGLFGLNEGWFDDYLPGLDRSVNAVADSQRIKAEREDSIALNDSLIAGAIAMQTGKTELNDIVKLSNKKSADAFKSFFWFMEKDEISYLDLTFWDGDYMEPEYCDQELLALMPYCPNLREIRIRDGEITDLTVLTECPSLERVYISAELFPMTIPENARFEIILD